MATSEKSPRTDKELPADLLPILQRSGILSESRFEDVRSRVLRGAYPFEPADLAKRLVKDRILTEYQARRLLSNRPGGMIIGRYLILEKLGSGSMGRVYKSQHRMMDRPVALKIIAPEISNNERVVARFQREIRMVGKLDHPNVVRAFDADRERGLLYIAMEYVAGYSLGQRLRNDGPIPPIELVGHAAQAARGLHHAHERSIVHRDVKPSNLMVANDGCVKVLDLGLGVLMEADEQATFATADGVAVGTIDYMSPEQACGQDVDPRSDLFSLGCTLYHVMSGRLPFQGDSPVERLGARITGEHVPIQEVRPDVPSKVAKVLDTLMANRPQDRYQTAEEAAEALDGLLKKRSSAVAKPPEKSPAAAEANVAKPPPPKIKYIEVKPELPAWFQPWADLAERSGALAFLLLFGLLAFVFGLGFVFGAFVLGQG